MTYFELVSTLKELEKNKNKDLYNKIMNPDIALYTDNRPCSQCHEHITRNHNCDYCY